MNLQARWHYHVARFFILARRNERAAQALRAALALERGFVPAAETLAYLYAESGRPALAIEQYRQALAADPGRSATWFNLGFVLHGEKQYGPAIEAFEKSLALNPRLDRAWYGAGLCRRELGQLAEAAQALEKAGKLQPMNGHAWYELGKTYHTMARRDKVREVIRYLNGFEPHMTMKLMRETGETLESIALKEGTHADAA